MAKILITGATGGLGSSVIAELTQYIPNNEIGVLVRNEASEKAQSFKEAGFELRVGDYNDSDSLEATFQNVEVLYFVSSNDLGERYSQHENVVNAAKKAGVKHIVYTSSVHKDATDNAPLFPVVGSHVQTEEWIKSSGISFTILRHNLYGEVIPMFIGDKTKLLESKTIFLPAKEGKAAFVARQDLAEAAAKVLSQFAQHENKIYELNGGEPISFSDVSQLISKITNVEISYVSPSKEEFEKTMASYGLPNEIIDLLSMFSLGIANEEFNSNGNDLEVLLGRKPQTMEGFLKEVYG